MMFSLLLRRSCASRCRASPQAKATTRRTHCPYIFATELRLGLLSDERGLATRSLDPAAQGARHRNGGGDRARDLRVSMDPWQLPRFTRRRLQLLGAGLARGAYWLCG